MGSAVEPVDAAADARLFLGLSVAATVALQVLPFGWTLGYPLRLVHTLAHELGHGLMAWVVGGRFDSLQLWADGSGLALTSGYSGHLASALVSAGGLCGPALASAGCFLAARRAGVARAALLLAGAALLAADVWVVRNPMGWLFITLFAAALLVLARRGSAEAAQGALVFLAVQLALSVFSRGDYLFTQVAHTGAGEMPSDVAAMAQALWLPFWFWGALCGLFSVAVLAAGGWLFLRRSPMRPGTLRG